MTGAARRRDEGKVSALIVGGDSLVGSAIAARLSARHAPVAGTSRRGGAGTIALDLAEPDVAALEGGCYDTAYVCAAVSGLGACQAAPAASRRVNVDGTLAVMRHLAGTGTRMVFLSSSQVFDGETAAPGEDQPTHPRNEYGRQKCAVEQAIAREALPVAVLRLTKVLAPRPTGVFGDWIGALGRGQPIRGANNMVLSPVVVEDVAQAAIGLAGAGHRGVWHLGASDEVTYHAAARQIALLQSRPPELVVAEEVTEAMVPAIFRQRHATLATGKVADALGLAIRSSRQALEIAFRTAGPP